MQSHIIRTVTKLDPSSSERTARFVLSTRNADRVGDTIDPAGWKLDNYRNNPVVLWGHDQHSPPIGKAENIGIDAQGRLVADIRFASASEYPFADTIYQLVRGGFVNAGSVGFKPLRWEINADGGLDFKEQELLEYSIVTVPCNPGALAQARKSIDLSPVADFVRGNPSPEFDQFRRELFANAPEAPAAPDNPGIPPASRPYKALAALAKMRLPR